MSCRIQIFVATDETPSNFVESIEAILDLNLNSVEYASVFAEYIDGQGRCPFKVLKNSLVNDHDKLFENYDYYISVNGCQSSQMAYAEWIFDRLKAAGKYPLMFTKDVQLKLAEYDPAAN